MLMSAPSPASPRPTPLNPAPTPSPPPAASTTSAWLQSVTDNTNNYVTSTISLSDSGANASGLVVQGTLSGVEVGGGGGGGNATGGVAAGFAADVTYVTSMQDLLYTLFVAAVLMVGLVAVHAGACALSHRGWSPPLRTRLGHHSLDRP